MDAQTTHCRASRSHDHDFVHETGEASLVREDERRILLKLSAPRIRGSPPINLAMLSVESGSAEQTKLSVQRVRDPPAAQDSSDLLFHCTCRRSQQSKKMPLRPLLRKLARLTRRQHQLTKSPLPTARDTLPFHARTAIRTYPHPPPSFSRFNNRFASVLLRLSNPCAEAIQELMASLSSTSDTDSRLILPN